jgi:TIR domain
VGARFVAMTRPPDLTPIDVFISYAREDRVCAGRFAEAFAGHGCQVWWDREIDVGADFSATIESALEAARTVVVLWSEHSVRSGFVKDEAARARDTGKLHPVRIADVPLPLGFGHIQTVDLFDCATTGEDFLSLVDQLRTPAATVPSDAGLRRRTGGLAQILKRRSTWMAAGVAAALMLVALLVSAWLAEKRCNAAFVTTDNGVQRLQEGNTEQAIDFFTEAIRMCDTRGPTYRYRGEAYARLNDYPLAVADLERALELGLEGHSHRRATELLARLTALQQAGAIPVTAASGDGEAAPPPRSSGSADGGGRPPDAAPPAGGASPGASAGSPAPPMPAPTGQPKPEPAPPRVEPSPDTAIARPSPVEPDPEVRRGVVNMFRADRDTRIEATTSLMLDPGRIPAAVPLAVQTALDQITNADGVINTLVLLQSAGPAVLQQNRTAIERLLARAGVNGPDTRMHIAKVRAAMAPIVYVHVAGAAQRVLGERLRQAIEAEGFEVPPVDNVGGRPGVPSTTPEIRIHGGSGRRAAQLVGRIVQNLAQVSPKILPIRDADPKRDTYEVWLDTRTCVARDRRPGACGP